jgi:MYXO-CTERM domain-containing protein
METGSTSSQLGVVAAVALAGALARRRRARGEGRA